MMKQKERGCKFVVVDPRITPTVTGLADVHLQLRPGTDGALALGFIHVMLRDGLYDKDFVEKWTHGFDELSGYVQEFTPERVEEITWFPLRSSRSRAHHLRERARDAGVQLGRRVPRHQRGQLPARGVLDHRADGRFGRGGRPGHGAGAAVRLLGVHCGVSTRGHVRREGPAGYPLRQG